MTKREYAQEIANIVGGEVKEVEKANGIIMTGIVCRSEGNMAPTIYIDKEYDNDTDIDEAADIVKSILKKNQPKGDFDVSILTSWEKVRPLLKARLYNNKTTADVKRSAKQYGFDDLQIVPYIDLDSYMPGGSTKVTEALVKEWGVTKRTVIDNALKNVQGDYTITSMSRILAEMMGEDPDMIPDDVGMFVVSNKSKCLGAISVIVGRDEIQRRFPKGYAVLPSSIHEVIVVPLTDEMNERNLTGMVNEVNATQVAPEEVLGDKAYIFKGVA